MQYSFRALACEEGGYVVVFPDLPGCITQVDTIQEIPAMSEDARVGWIETAYELGQVIPLPSFAETYSGKFNVRLLRSLHRTLAESAEEDGLSLNQYVATLLARGDTQARLEGRLEELAARIDALSEGPPTGRPRRVAETPAGFAPASGRARRAARG